ncbi:MAG: spore germination protein [Firmicutes bacterium]|nr:spore germination protein [Bacillota bacterium]
MKEYIQKLQKEFANTPDLIIKNFKINPLHKIYVVFLETLCSQDKINDYVLKSLTNKKTLKNIESEIPGGNVIKLAKYDLCESFLYNGFTLIIDGKDIYAIETKGDLTRSVTTNETEPALKGPKNAFVESYQTNIGLVKRRIRSSHLKIKNLNIGRLSNNPVGILYIDNITKPELVQKVYDKLKKIDTDLLCSIESLISYLGDKSHFPTVITTERPDRCAEALAEGKIVIICDESPFALIVPAFLIDFINPFSDKYAKSLNINFTKLIRFLCFFLSAVVPAFYIAIINYNQEAIPTSLIINFAIQREGVPFPAIIECIIMLVICEILRESDLRFPSKYGSAISILGALVLGDAAVNAGLVSPIMIIITAFTYISSLIFTEAEIGNALRNYRFLFLVMSAFFGLYGLFVTLLFFLVNLVNTSSLGYPYTFPASPYDKSYFKEFLFKRKNKTRSPILSKNKTKEQE